MASISLTPTTALSGVNIAINGTGFGKRLAVTILVDTTVVAHSKSNIHGAFSTIFVLPVEVAGAHTVYARDSVESASASLTVLAVPAPIPTPTYTFQDDFSGTAIDITKWGFHYRPSGLPLTQWDHSLASVSGGYLHLKAVKKSDGLWYSSSVDTKTSFQQKYGIFESRIKIPKGKGLWPAGPWGYNDTTGQEIDGMEILSNPVGTADTNHDVQCLHCTVHWSGASTSQDGTPIHTGVDLSGDFHVYGFEWRSTFIKWTLDGVIVKTVTDPTHIPTVALPVILDLGVSGWAGPTDSTTPNPSEMLVDWVRVGV